MTKNEESLDEIQANELQDHYEIVDEIINEANTTRAFMLIATRVSTSLLRIAHAQEKLVAFTQIDIEQTIEAEIQSRAETMANEIVEDKSKRGFIGKK